MELQPSKDATAILASVRSSGITISAATILRSPLPDKRWWAIVSEGSRSSDPYWHAIKQLAALMIEAPEISPWPPALFETEKSLPAVSREEAIAIIDCVCRLERGVVETGIQLFPLQWDVLSAHYCPLRERHEPLKSLVSEGLLSESARLEVHQESGMHWPLTLSSPGVAIRRLKVEVRMPFFKKLEEGLAHITTTYPILSKAVIWAIAGGGFVAFVDWLRWILSS